MNMQAPHTGVLDHSQTQNLEAGALFTEPPWAHNPFKQDNNIAQPNKPHKALSYQCMYFLLKYISKIKRHF